MNAYEPREVIRDLKTVRLTQWGQIKLSAFPDAALIYAEGQMKGFQGTRAFYAFKVHAEAWCTQNNLRPDWSRAKKVSLQYGQPNAAAMENVTSWISGTSSPSFQNQRTNNLTNQRTFMASSFPTNPREAGGEQNLPKKGNPNPHFPGGRVRAIEVVMAELNKFAILRKDEIASASWDYIFGFGQAFVYFARVINNLEIEYLQALNGEPKTE